MAAKKKPTVKAKINKTHEDYMVELIKANTSYSVEREYRFDQREKDKELGLPRRWRFDAALIEPKIAFECEGGSFNGGRHTNPIGFMKDLEKYNTATMMGWKVYRFTPNMLSQGWIETILKEVM